MAITITNPKNWLLKPLFWLLVIVAIPFALLFSLARIPFAKRSKRKLEEILEQDWLPREKYVYIGFNSNYSFTDFIQDEILPKYGQHIVWDMWDDEKNEWSASEPDTIKRVATFWQYIGGDFDGDLRLVIAHYSPNEFIVSHDKGNFHDFYDPIDQTDKLNTQIENIICGALKPWGVE